jgi:hypothetical protein
MLQRHHYALFVTNINCRTGIAYRELIQLLLNGIEYSVGFEDG